jgi:hypothetical protein
MKVSIGKTCSSFSQPEVNQAFKGFAGTLTIELIVLLEEEKNNFSRKRVFFLFQNTQLERRRRCGNALFFFFCIDTVRRTTARCRKHVLLFFSLKFPFLNMSLMLLYLF